LVYGPAGDVLAKLLQPLVVAWAVHVATDCESPRLLSRSAVQELAQHPVLKQKVDPPARDQGAMDSNRSAASLSSLPERPMELDAHEWQVEAKRKAWWSPARGGAASNCLNDPPPPAAAATSWHAAPRAGHHSVLLLPAQPWPARELPLSLLLHLHVFLPKSRSFLSCTKIIHKSLVPSSHDVPDVRVWSRYVNITWIVSPLIFCTKCNKLLAPVFLLPPKGKNSLFYPYPDWK
jgi:hypothetical protein